MTRIVLGALLAGGVLLGARNARAQEVDAVTAAYYRAAAQAYRIPEPEVLILAEWGLPADEMPVVLYLARLTRVSPDAVIAQRRQGQAWSAILSQKGIGADRLHIELPGSPPAPLTEAYAGYASLPRERWGELRLTDPAVVYLVNIRFLADHTGTPPARVLEVRRSEANFAAAYRALIGAPAPG